MIKKWKKLSEEVIHKNPWWTYKHDTFEKTDGNIGDYFYGECRGNAMVIPVLPDGRIVMVNMYRYIRNEESLEFPCGGIEQGSTAEETAGKELLEETGYPADRLVFLGKYQGLNGVFENQCHAYIAYVSAQEQQHLEVTEQIDISYHTVFEVQGFIDAGKIWDGQSLAIWALARRYFSE